MAKKRKLEEFVPSDIHERKDGVSIHGVMTELSPIKVSQKNTNVKYFTGKITDGKKTLRMVSSDSVLGQRLNTYQKDVVPVCLTECQVKDASGSADFEIVASPRRTNALKSEKKFELPKDLNMIDPDTAKTILLEELQDIAVNQSTSVQAKAVRVGMPEDVQSKTTWRVLQKQECVIADTTGSGRLVLWQNDINRR